MENIVLKHIPEEFSVHENISLSYDPEGNYFYYKLLKKGYSTFDAVRMIAEHFDLEKDKVQYAGLKDEDGCTQQTISLDTTIDHNKLNVFNLDYAGDEAFLKLIYLGRGEQPLRIGALNGNGFLITVRNIDSEIISSLQEGSMTFLYLNYYGHQRFGLPNKPKLTHLIGKALVEQNFDEAFELVKRSEASESELAKLYVGNSKEFFQMLDKRLLTFYTSAYSSYQWNKSLGDMLLSLSEGDDIDYVEEEGIPFVYGKSSKQLIKLMLKMERMPYTRYSINSAMQFELSYDFRSTVLQTNIRVRNFDKDDVFSSKIKMVVSFFLFKGSYATTMLSQFYVMKKAALKQGSNSKIMVS